MELVYREMAICPRDLSFFTVFFDCFMHCGVEIFTERTLCIRKFNNNKRGVRITKQMFLNIDWANGHGRFLNFLLLSVIYSDISPRVFIGKENCSGN